MTDLERLVLEALSEAVAERTAQLVDQGVPEAQARKRAEAACAAHGRQLQEEREWLASLTPDAD
jgi:hypothetical protein